MCSTSIINCLFLLLCLIYKCTVLGDSISTVHGEFCYSSNDTEGRCVSFTECQPLLSILHERPISKSDLRLLVNLTCTFDLYNPLICCPSKDIVPIPTGVRNGSGGKSNNNSSATDISYKNHRNFNLMPSFDECSVQTGDDDFKARQKVSRGEFPWMALIGYLNPETDALEFLCGGTVINHRYILTAAHCAVRDGGIKPKVIRLAEHDLVNDPDCSNTLGKNRVECSYAKDMLVDKIISHPKYDFLDSSLVQNNDVALIRTTQDILFNDFVRPVCLPFVADYELFSFPSENLNNSQVSLTAGWGKVSHSQQGNPVMEVVPMPIKPKEDCSAFHFTPNELTREQICAGGDQGSCGSDSGGPLMILGGQKYSPSKLFQIGVTSFGPLFCSHGVPNIYTRVASQLQWILDNIEP